MTHTYRGGETEKDTQNILIFLTLYRWQNLLWWSQAWLLQPCTDKAVNQQWAGTKQESPSHLPLPGLRAHLNPGPTGQSCWSLLGPLSQPSIPQFLSHSFLTGQRPECQSVLHKPCKSQMESLQTLFFKNKLYFLPKMCFKGFYLCTLYKKCLGPILFS